MVGLEPDGGKVDRRKSKFQRRRIGLQVKIAPVEVNEARIG